MSLLIPGTSLKVSPIGYGCGALGGWEPGPLPLERADKAARLVFELIEEGINFFDLADVYGAGKAEEALGHALHQRPVREDIVIQTKCGQSISKEWRFGEPISIRSSRDYIVQAAEASLKRLGTDYIDIFMLHVPDPLAEFDGVAEAFEALFRAGKVRSFGVSNFGPSQIELLQRATDQKIVANQIGLSLGRPHLIADGYESMLESASGQLDFRTSVGVAASGTVDYCRLNRIQLQAYSPLKGGLSVEGAAPNDVGTARLVATMAESKGVEPSAILLAWLLRHPAKIIPFIGTGSLAHARAALAALDIELTAQEWYDLLLSRKSSLSRKIADLKTDG